MKTEKSLLSNFIRQPIHQFNNWIHQNILSISHKCIISSQQAIYICVDQTCSIENPFLCLQNQCKCIQIHQSCKMRSLKYVLKILSTKHQSHNQELQNNLIDMMDNLVDRISQIKDQIAKSIKLEHTSHIFSADLLKTTKFINQIKTNKLSGYIIQKLINTDFHKKLKIQLNETNQRMKKKIQQFIKDKLNPFLIQLRKELIGQPQLQKSSDQQKFNQKDIKWSKQLRTFYILTKQNKVICSEQYRFDSTTKLCLLQPRIELFKRNKIIWRIRINQFTQFDNKGNIGVIGFGIVYKQYCLNDNRYYRYDLYQSHDNYFAICGYKMYMKQHQYDADKKVVDIKLQKGDIIRIELNKSKNKLKFINQSTDHKKTILKQKNKHKKTQDQYFGVLLNHKESQIQLLSVQTQSQLYTIENSQIHKIEK